jgi:hypothetical protein
MVSGLLSLWKTCSSGGLSPSVLDEERFEYQTARPCAMRNEAKRSETQRNETKRNETPPFLSFQCVCPEPVFIIIIIVIIIIIIIVIIIIIIIIIIIMIIIRKLRTSRLRACVLFLPISP